MKCPKCGSTQISCFDTRPGKYDLSIRRRRKCTYCWHRGSTIEVSVEDAGDTGRAAKCIGCYYCGKRSQKCVACVRNPLLKDFYEEG